MVKRMLSRNKNIPQLHKVFSIFFAFAFIAAAPLSAEYPRIYVLTNRDVIFKQLQEDIKRYYAAKSRGKHRKIPVLSFFRYRLKDTDDIFTLSAKLNLPYDTIATLNHIANPEELTEHEYILIPNIPGIFVPQTPVSDLDNIMIGWRMQKYDTAKKIYLWRTGIQEEFLFFEGERFHSIERAYFLKILFRFPLDMVRLTSRFGVRSDPFTGHPSFHNGIDLGVPVGTPVYAAKDGTVIETGYSKVYGNYIVLDHAGNYQTVYGHLSKILVTLHEKVQSGVIIAKSGMTGRCTGPHLHFEIRRKGAPADPVPLLPTRE
jgi:murein DD-endopeptidase MepM/ murein hydrolase activator NlpD